MLRFPHGKLILSTCFDLVVISHEFHAVLYGLTISFMKEMFKWT